MIHSYRAICILATLSGYLFDVPHAQAQERKIYIGAGLGAAKSDSASTQGVETRDTGASVYIGQRFSTHLGAEAGFSYLGEYATSSGSYVESFSALSGKLVGYVPLSHSGFTFTGRVGYGFLAWQRELDAGTFKITTRDSGDTVLAGVGLDYDLGLAQKLTFRLLYDYYYYATSNSLTGESSSSHSLGLLSLNVSVNLP